MNRNLIRIALTSLILLSGALLALADIELTSNVIGSGGGDSQQVAAIGLKGTVGQPLVGIQQTALYTLCTGFWCNLGGPTSYPIYLPLVVKNT